MYNRYLHGPISHFPAQGRRRYPSESGVSNHRPYVAKPPPYQAIEEEASPLPDSPGNYPPNMQQRTTDLMRPNQLQIGDNLKRYPPSSTNTPLMEQAPMYLVSPSGQPGRNTLSNKPMRRANSEIPAGYSAKPRIDLPHPQSAPTFYSSDIHSKSNPTTPDVDPNHNSFFRDQADPSQVRKRNPSGKSVSDDVRL